MSITHHPDEAALAAYAAGALDPGQHVAIATHLTACAHCRDWARTLERVGGALLADAPPADLSDDALGCALRRLDDPLPPAAAPAPEVEDAPPLLPRFVKSYRFGAWRRVTSRIGLRPIVLPEPSPTRVFLLKSAPGAKMLRHAHTVTEMTCVLAGAFSHEGGRFEPGDFDFGDESVHHEPHVDEREECVCLIAMQGELRLEGLIGWLMQRFVRL